MRSNPKERDSREVRCTQGTADDKRDSHPHRCFFPKGLHLRLHWQYIFRLQFKARGPNFHAELIPVHSPLLRESYLVSYPPLTYMLKFSGFAGLTSCLGEARTECAHRTTQGLIPKIEQQAEPTRAPGTLLIIGEPNTLHAPGEAPRGSLTHKHAQHQRHTDGGAKSTGSR